MDVELLTVGSELLLGFTVDTNAVHIAQTLARHGLRLTRHVTVADVPAEIARAMRDGLARTGVVLTTGGLGPTPDDVTREAAATVAGVPLELDEAVLATVRDRFSALGRPAMAESNRVQALVPRGAMVLPNPHGTAPGLWLETLQGVLVLMPGVPREMRAMLADQVVPRLTQRTTPGAADPRTVHSHTLRTTGVSESTLATQLEEIARDLGDVRLAFLPGVEGVDLRLTWGPGHADTGRDVVAVIARRVRNLVGLHWYGEESEDLAKVLLDALEKRAMRLAVAESCTGGMVGARLTAVPGASRVFEGGVVSYGNRSKERELGVPTVAIVRHGAVSQEVALAMARGVAGRFATDAALAVSGVAGPDGGTADKPVGTVCLAAVVGSHERVLTRRFPGDREEIRQRAAQAALDLGRRLLLEEVGG
ncbi:MAG TPA: competence/damage-inducible protein A [Gemmatimonadales bacterium]|jgi:nicotinamide-nucleotide amidase